jgi:glycosyltransferase involved in cell wall biosynthesis
MRILAVTLDYPPDTLFGSGVVNHDLYTALAHAGHEITVITPGRGRGGVIREPSGVVVWETPDELTRAHLIPPDRPGESFGDFADIRTWNIECVRWLRQVREPTLAPHVIHNHGWVTQPIADQLAHYHRAPIVTTAHVIDRHYQALPGHWPRATDPRYQAAEEASFAHSTRIILPSHAAHDLAAHYYPKHRHKLAVVEHGLNWSTLDAAIAGNGDIARPRPARSHTDGSSEVRVLFVGRLGTERSWEPFLRAFRTAADENHGLRLRVIGHGPGLERGRNGFRHRAVEFLGKLPRHLVLHEVAAADIFCNPALVETFGVAELEAMALATCVISGTGRGKNTLVDHLTTGVTIPTLTSDDGLKLNEQDWTRWLLRLAGDRPLRQRLGQHARDSVRPRYTADRAAAGLLAVLQHECGQLRR